MTSNVQLGRSIGIESLLDAVHTGPSPIKALKALSVLNLEPRVWFEVAEAAIDMLGQADDQPESAGEIVAAAVQVPVEDVRDAMRRVLVYQSDSDASTNLVMPGRALRGPVSLALAYALARAGDGSGVE